MLTNGKDLGYFDGIWTQIAIRISFIHTYTNNFIIKEWQMADIQLGRSRRPTYGNAMTYKNSTQAFYFRNADYCSCCMTYHLELNYMSTSMCLFSDCQSFRRCLYCVYVSIISYESNVSYLRHLHKIHCPDPTEIFTSTVCLLFICCFLSWYLGCNKHIKT